jgi:hypothetical protein
MKRALRATEEENAEHPTPNAQCRIKGGSAVVSFFIQDSAFGVRRSAFSSSVLQ